MYIEKVEYKDEKYFVLKEYQNRLSLLVFQLDKKILFFHLNNRSFNIHHFNLFQK